MDSLGDKIESVLSEARILLLGGQVMLGFSYRICFESKLGQLSDAGRISELFSVVIVTAVLAWLIWPAAYHQVAEDGEPTEKIHRLMTTVLDWGLLPVAVGLGSSLFPVALILKIPHPMLIGASGTVLALGAWYSGRLAGGGSEQRQRMSEKLKREEREMPNSDFGLSDRIKKVMLECRMVLPGAQAFLGFQFAIVFAEGFSEVPRELQLTHFGSLLAMMVSIILLIAPAAFHRLAEAGENTERLHTVASRLLLAAMVFLAPGMAADLYVVVAKVSGSNRLAVSISTALLIFCYGLWFGYGWWAKRYQPQDA